VKRPGPAEFFRQSLKSNSYFADELINIYLLRPIAAVFVWLVYPTNITPNQVTLLAIVLGCCSAVMYLVGTTVATIIAGVFIMLKDIFDDADGQLARARAQYSLRGRFLDSIGDFFVDLAVSAAIGIGMYREQQSVAAVIPAFFAFWGITLRVSYHVFYQASFLHLEGSYSFNRIVEEVTDEDKRGDPIALRLQQIFNVLYGWQDRLMLRLDEWSRGRNFDVRLLSTWYGDRFSLRLSGFLGFGTELSLLALCSFFRALELYLWLNIVLMNGIWLLNISYRKVILAKNLR